MITEFLTIAAILIGGIAYARAAGFEGWILPAIGMIAGISLQITITGLLVMCQLPTSALLIVCLTMFIPVAWWLACCQGNKNVAVSLLTVVGTGFVLLVAVFAFAKLNLVKLSPDSFNYLNMGALLSSGNMEFAAPNWLQLRSVGVAAIHAPANLSGAYYLRSITPLLSLSVVTMLAWIGCRWYQSTAATRSTACGVAVVAAILLATHHRFVYHAFYINGHMIMAACLLIVAGGSWLLAESANVNKQAIWLLQLICIPPLVMTRPDGALFAGLALLPAIVSEQFSHRHRAVLMATLGGSIVAWHCFLWHRYAASGDSPPISVSGMIGLGVLSLVAIPVMSWRLATPYLKHVLTTVEASLWIGLIGFVIRDTGSMRESVRATFHNVVLDAGGWGISLKLLSIVVVLSLLFTRIPNRIHLRFPVTTFLPLYFLLGDLRHLPYRIGAGDSLNRMFLHILPIAILIVVSAAKSQRILFIGAREGLQLPTDKSPQS